MARNEQNALCKNHSSETSLSKQFMLCSALVIAEKIVTEKKKNNG